ncbi:family 78 glycoside hydrolase catalytic domain [Cyclobacterium amurskyense]|uniref:family 78 glycoside hydrolase catalytic domain n=1 Tax=Cyclobacterium amurskyense TaxID=320787 RepID=UPI0030DCD1D3
MIRSVHPIWIFLIGLIFACSEKIEFKVNALKVNHLTTSLGLEDNPVFSWQMEEGLADFFQQNYRILVATKPEFLTKGKVDLWDSGEVGSDRSLGISYEGKTLESGTKVYWKVLVQDKKGAVYESQATWFEMGLKDPNDWKALWIASTNAQDSIPGLTPAPYFRKEFSIDKPIQSARLYIAGLGYHEAYINGEKVGDHVLDPAMTRYDKTVKYVVHDVTSLLNNGENAIGVVLGNGWYNQHTREAWDFDQAPWRGVPVLRAQLRIVDAEGKALWIHTDESWKYTLNGPIIFDSVHNGESYDAGEEMEGWTSPDFDDSNWEAAHQASGPKGEMVAQLMPPIRVIDTLSPKNQWEINDSTFMYDLGQNITGWANIKVKGPANARVKIRYGERIYPDSTLDIKELSRFIWSGDTQTDRYYLKGDGAESWHPIFTYQGFQYMEVTLSEPEIELLEINAAVLHTDLPEKGYFRSSNAMFNRLQENMRWSFLGNYHGYPTDCPHREKMGWTGDALLVAEIGNYNFDMVPAYRKWLDDFVDEQQDSGDLPGIIPTSGWGYTFNQGLDKERGYGPHWEGAFLEVAWQMYRFSGDSLLLARYYPNMKKYVDYLEANAEGYLLKFGIDDHKQLENLTQGPFLSTAFFHYFSNLLAKMAGVLGELEDQEAYLKLSKNIAKAFNQAYFNPQTGRYDHGGQASQAVPLFTGLVPKEKENLVLAGLLNAIDTKKGHIDAGVVGTKAIIQVLMDYQQVDVLFEMANKRTFPSWGYWVDELNANTMFQNWDGSQSRNHIMFGTIGDYFFKGLAGIRPIDESPGFKRFIIEPSLASEIEWVEAGHDSPYGMIKCHWRRTSGQVELSLTVPSNTVAELRLPANNKLLPVVEQGASVLFERVSDEKGGEWFMADLPGGNYQIKQKVE